MALFAFFLAGLFRALSYAQDLPPASVEAKVDKTEITIGDHVQYTLTIEYDEGVEVQTPTWGQGLEGFQILDFDKGEPEKAGQRWKAVDTYTLSTFTPEEYVIAPLRVPVKLPSGATQVLETQPIAVKVASVLPDDDKALDLRDIKAPVPVYSGILTGRVVMAILVALAILAFLYALWRRRRRGELPDAVVPPRPEHEAALERLEALERTIGGWDPEPGQVHCKEFGLELSETLREYLERRYGFIALEMTTDEIRRILPTILQTTTYHPAGEKGSGVCDRALRILEDTDLMKFAKTVFSRDDLLDQVRTCREVVEATWRRPEPSERDAELFELTEREAA